MASRSLPDLTARIKIDTTDLSAAGKRVNTEVKAMGVQAQATSQQVTGLGQAHQGFGRSLVQTSPLVAGYSGALTKEEGAHNRVHLATLNSSKATREFGAEANAAARALGPLGEAGGRATARMAALGSVIGSGGAMGLGIAGLLAGLGAVVLGTKSAIDITEAQEKAERNLAQAYREAGLSVGNYRGQIDQFLTTNKPYIRNIQEAENAYAALTRAGFDQAMVQRLINDGLDLSVAKNVSLEDAVNALIIAHAGSARALRTLGISQKEINDDLAEGATSTEKFEALLGALEPKIAGVRENESSLEQQQNQLNADWNDLAQNIGPPVIATLGGIASAADAVAVKLGDIGKSGGPGGTSFWDKLNEIVVTDSLVVEVLASKIGLVDTATVNLALASRTSTEFVRESIDTTRTYGGELTTLADISGSTTGQQIADSHNLAQARQNDINAMEGRVTSFTAEDERLAREATAIHLQALNDQVAAQQRATDEEGAAMNRQAAAINNVNDYIDSMGDHFDRSAANSRSALQSVAGGANALRDSLLRIPSDITVRVHADIRAAQEAIGEVSVAISNLQYRQHGGPVIPGGVYQVGEAGPETLVMGRGGGYVIPNAGGSSQPAAGGGIVQNLQFNQVMANPYQIADEVGWAVRTVRRT